MDEKNYQLDLANLALVKIEQRIDTLVDEGFITQIEGLRLYNYFRELLFKGEKN